MYYGTPKLSFTVQTYPEKEFEKLVSNNDILQQSKYDFLCQSTLLSSVSGKHAQVDILSNRMYFIHSELQNKLPTTNSTMEDNINWTSLISSMSITLITPCNWKDL